jgi:UDP-N-acetylmuramoylalanine--D-glutamate ligase
MIENVPTAKGAPPSIRGRALIVGLGKTGLSCARFLRGAGVPVAVTDTRRAPPALSQLRAELPDVALFLGGFRDAVFAAADCLVVSPGVSTAIPEIQAAAARGVPVLGDIELFAKTAQAPIVAITGSNGKSTVTTLVGSMARRAGRRVAVGGNLGEPALDLLSHEVGLYVLELSSFQLETTHSLHPSVAAVLNLSADHMDRYPDLSAYAAAKARIFRRAEVAVVNLDDAIVTAMPTGDAERRGFTLDAPAEGVFGVCAHDDEPWLCCGSNPWMPAGDLQIPGHHNRANALAALAIGAAAGLPQETMLAAARDFEGLAHRSELVGERAGVRWYDDSKGTNPGATVAALEGFAGTGGRQRVVLIAGGDGKGADFSPLAGAVARAARAVVLIGRDAPRIADALRGHVPLQQAVDMDDAVRLAAALAQPGDSVLLSPACASFDMYESYAHRGEVFAAAVRRLTR